MTTPIEWVLSTIIVGKPRYIAQLQLRDWDKRFLIHSTCADPADALTFSSKRSANDTLDKCVVNDRKYSAILNPI